MSAQIFPDVVGCRAIKVPDVMKGSADRSHEIEDGFERYRNAVRGQQAETLLTEAAVYLDVVVIRQPWAQNCSGNLLRYDIKGINYRQGNGLMQQCFRSIRPVTKLKVATISFPTYGWLKLNLLRMGAVAERKTLFLWRQSGRVARAHYIFIHSANQNIGTLPVLTFSTFLSSVCRMYSSISRNQSMVCVRRHPESIRALI